MLRYCRCRVLDFKVVDHTLGGKVGLKLADAPEGSGVRVLFALIVVNSEVIAHQFDATSHVSAIARSTVADEAVV